MQPLSETVPNVAIDLGVVAAGVGLWVWEDGRGKASLEALTEKKGTKTLLTNLEVELFDGATSNMRGLEGKYRPVLLAGTAAEVTRSINLAGRVAADLKRNDMLLVPFFTDLDDDAAGWQAMKDSSTNGMWDSFLARPLNRESWTQWLLAEKSQVAEKNKENQYNIDTKAFGMHPTPPDRSATISCRPHFLQARKFLAGTKLNLRPPRSSGFRQASSRVHNPHGRQGWISHCRSTGVAQARQERRSSASEGPVWHALIDW